MFALKHRFPLLAASLLLVMTFPGAGMAQAPAPTLHEPPSLRPFPPGPLKRAKPTTKRQNVTENEVSESEDIILEVSLQTTFHDH